MFFLVSGGPPTAGGEIKAALGDVAKVLEKDLSIFGVGTTMFCAGDDMIVFKDVAREDGEGYYL